MNLPTINKKTYLLIVMGIVILTTALLVVFLNQKNVAQNPKLPAQVGQIDDLSGSTNETTTTETGGVQGDIAAEDSSTNTATPEDLTTSEPVAENTGETLTGTRAEAGVMEAQVGEALNVEVAQSEPMQVEVNKAEPLNVNVEKNEPMQVEAVSLSDNTDPVALECTDPATGAATPCAPTDAKAKCGSTTNPCPDTNPEPTCGTTATPPCENTPSVVIAACGTTTNPCPEDKPQDPCLDDAGNTKPECLPGVNLNPQEPQDPCLDDAGNTKPECLPGVNLNPQEPQDPCLDDAGNTKPECLPGVNLNPQEPNLEKAPSPLCGTAANPCPEEEKPACLGVECDPPKCLGVECDPKQEPTCNPATENCGVINQVKVPEPVPTAVKTTTPLTTKPNPISTPTLRPAAPANKPPKLNNTGPGNILLLLLAPAAAYMVSRKKQK